MMIKSDNINDSIVKKNDRRVTLFTKQNITVKHFNPLCTPYINNNNVVVVT